MNIIYSVCPNCGHTITFYENQGTCKCVECKKKFIVIKNSDGTYTLSQKNGLSLISVIICAFLVLLVSVLAFLYKYNDYNSTDYDAKSNSKITNETKKEEVSFLMDINDLNDNYLEMIDVASKNKILSKSYFNNYKIIDYPNRIKIYLLNKKDSNMLIPIYLSKYSNGINNYDVYTPVIYENIKINYTNDKLFDSMPIIKDNNSPNIYFNDEKTEYTVGYKNINDLYNNTIKPLEDKYFISEK